MTAIAFITVSVSNHYAAPSFASEVTSQGLLGEQVTILDHQPPFTHIRQADGYESWIDTDQISTVPPPSGKPIRVRSHFVRIHRNPDPASAGVRDAVFGSTLAAIGEVDGWHEIGLPGGDRGWAEKGHFRDLPPGSPEGIVSLAREFLGYQYAWGGRSPKGFDCSGFVQTVFGAFGMTLPRDSWQQQQHHQISKNFEDARPADLLFFARTPERITHVAIALGGGRFIHASGWVRIDSLRESDADFSVRHRDTFVSVNRYPLPGE